MINFTYCILASAVSAMAAGTTPLKHDGIYYYSSDLNKASDLPSETPDNPEETKDMDIYYYESGLQGAPPPKGASKSPPKTSETDPYYNNGAAGDAVVKETKTPASTTGSYQNVSSVTAKRTKNAPTPKVSRQLPAPPKPPVPKSDGGNPKSKPTGQRHDEAETSFGSMPAYTNTGKNLPPQNPDVNYEMLDSNDRDTSNVYAELK